MNFGITSNNITKNNHITTMESLQTWQNRFEGFAEVAAMATGPYGNVLGFLRRPFGINGMWDLYFDMQSAGLEDAALGIAAEYLPQILERGEIEDLSALATLFVEKSSFTEEYGDVCAKIAEKIQ